ncbi:hypothetical protein [Stenotrophomonas geniculata]|uniref:hypothetical protein n=1 Tax=Stenotrophomonas geniculata TaxID=86188 RepID=UPI002E79DCD4|nr:hypothetical protein [Stenotrophomonas geniculata]
MKKRKKLPKILLKSSNQIKSYQARRKLMANQKSAVKPHRHLSIVADNVLKPLFVGLSCVAIAAWLGAAFWMKRDLQGFFRSFPVDVYLALLLATVVVWQCTVDLLDWKGAPAKNLASVGCRLAGLFLALFALVQRDVITSPFDWFGKL